MRIRPNLGLVVEGEFFGEIKRGGNKKSGQGLDKKRFRGLPLNLC
jgi:hypothetical protein